MPHTATRRRSMLLIIVMALATVSQGCARVPAGHRGIKVYLLGHDKGVNEVELGVGRYAYWPITQEIYIFPVFQQNTVWSRRGEAGDQSLTFQTREGVSVNGDFGISYSIDPAKVSVLFQRYRRGIEEITNLFIRNMVQDALNLECSNHTIEHVYGPGRQALLKAVEDKVRKEVQAHGIIIDRLYAIGDFRLPPRVVQAINAKIEATQRSEQRENEVREARAEAAKKVARTRGEVEAMKLRAQGQTDMMTINARAEVEAMKLRAQGKADMLTITARAEAEANRLRSNSLTPNLLMYQMITRWNGQLPQVTGEGALPFTGFPQWQRTTTTSSSKKR